MGRKRKFDKHLPHRMYLRRGSYYFVYPDGKWFSLGTDYAKAMAKYGELTDPGRPCVTLGEVIEKYQLRVLPHKAQSTQRCEAPQLTRLASVFGEMIPDEITTQHIYQYMDARATKHPIAARQEVTLLHHVFVKAIRWGAASTNPAHGIEKPKSKPRTRYVTDGEFMAVWKLASPQLKVAMDLALLTGLRRGDLLSLTRDNLTEDGILVQTSKTGKSLLIQYTPALEEVLASSKKLKPQVPGRYLLRNMQGKPYTSNGFSANWQRLMTKAVKSGIERFSFHDIRSKSGIERFSFHDIRSKSASDSDSLQEASERLGHSSTSLTKRTYYRKALPVKPLR